MVQSALGDKKSKLGVSFLYDMPNNIMPRGNHMFTIVTCYYSKIIYNVYFNFFRYKCTRKSR